MCGIAGYINPVMPTAERSDAVDRMLARMIHRGPDDGAMLSLGPATVGMRRLAIFDPAMGRQPMSSPDGRFHLVFNGAIYNHLDWRRRLADRWEFRTHCDTEALLAALVLEGTAALPRLRGMYAFALWDAHDETLLVARDPLGIKPLYYWAGEHGEFAFASELGALRTLPVIATARVDPNAVAQYLAWLAVPAPLTLWQGVRALLPGESLRWQAGKLQARPKLGLDELNGVAAIDEESRPAASAAAFQRELRARLEDTVQAHLLADVPVGTFLSGGLDSALISALAKQASPSLKTFSIGFDDPAHSEVNEAEATARFLGTDHHTEIVSGRRVVADLDRILTALDQPSGDGINTFYACETARAGGVKVALSGLGADELFGGYPSFRRTAGLWRAHRIGAALPGSLQNAAFNLLARGDTARRKFADTLRDGTSMAGIALLQRRVFDQTTARQLQRGEGLSSRHPALANLEKETVGLGLLGVTSAAEIRGYMTDVLLRDSDVMSMRHSLELRVPFVDAPLMAWLRVQPEAWRFDRRHPKGALYAAVADLLPPDLANRQKRGFTPPFARWMKNELRPFLDEIFSSAQLRDQAFIDPAPLERLWHHFLAGHDDRAWSRLWSLALLLAFIRRSA